MLKTILKWLLIAVIIGAIYYYVTKATNASKLKVTVDKITFPISLSSVTDLMGGSLIITVNVNIGNYSTVPYTINQISIDAFTEKGTPVATQLSPLAVPVTISPNANNVIPIQYKIGYNNIIALLQDSGILSAPSITDLITNFALTQSIGAKINLKGFVVAESIKVNVDLTQAI